MNTTTASRFTPLAGFSIMSGLFKAARWAFGQFMQAPLRNIGIAVLSLGMLVSANNALYWQRSLHPAPLFAPSNSAANVYETPQRDMGAPLPVQSRPSRPETTPAMPSDQAQSHPALETGNIAVGNQQVAQVQQKLASFGLFAGKIDGYYGPVTAKAIREFEQRRGLPPKGAFTPEIIAQILNATNIDARPNDPAAHDGASLNATSGQPMPDVLSALAQSAAGRTTPPLPVASVPPQSSAPVVDKATIQKVQRGLSSLGFLYGPIDGIAGQATARAIRNFEVYQNFEVTGAITPELVDLLLAAGASI